MQTVIIKSINQCLQDVLLTGHFGKRFRAPFSGKDLIAHINFYVRTKLYYRQIKAGLEELMVVTLNSHTSAHDGTTTVAPFRAWRGLQIIVAREPKRATFEASAAIIRGLLVKCNKLSRYPHYLVSLILRLSDYIKHFFPSHIGSACLNWAVCLSVTE